MPSHHAEIVIPSGREAEARAFYGGLLGLPAPPARAAFVAERLDGLRSRLEQADLEVKDAPPVDGRRRFHVWDPFGNRLEFVEGTPRP